MGTSELIKEIYFENDISAIIHNKATKIVSHGGPQSIIANQIAKETANKIKKILSVEQHEIINNYIERKICAIVFNGFYHEKLKNLASEIPLKLPAIEELDNDLECLLLGAINQILLALVEQTAFAYDIDNYGKIIRFVGNFKGGGATKLECEDKHKIDKSSHSGIALGAHTEAPYNCISNIKDDHSPAPSSLILTARWNPLSEPTTIIPIEPILEKLSIEEAMALSTHNFDFTRSETFTEGKGNGGENIAILELDKYGRIGMKYNSYRFSVNKNAPVFVKNVFSKFESLINYAPQIKINIKPHMALIINNTLALHCRDIIQDNRRLLIRLFGYSHQVEYITLTETPLLVKG